MRRLVFIPALIFVILSGCSKSTKIDAPSYIEISDYKVITDSSYQGTANQNFTDVLVSTGTQSYGYFPIPGKIPIPAEGATYLSIRGAIKVNGISALRVDYPMFKGCDTTLPLQRGKTLKLTPVFKYYPTVSFKIVEGFENLNLLIKNSSPTDSFTAQIDTTANVAFGHACLRLQMDANHPSVQVQSTYGGPLPSDGTNVYVEMNYKGDIQLEVGLIGSSSPSSLVNPSQRAVGGINASSTWKKLYFSLSDLIRTPPSSPYWFLYFYSTTGFDASQSSPKIYIDNVKLVVQ